MVSLDAIDKSIVLALNGFVSASWLGVVVSAIAVYGVYVIPLVWLIWWFVTGKKQRQVLMSAMLAGLIGWQVVNRIVKFFVYLHPRPMDELEVAHLPVKEFLFNRPGASFPSDHAAFFGGIAFFFFLFQKQKATAGWLLLFGIVVSAARVAMAAHYPSDIVIGLLDGFIAAWLVTLVHQGLVDTVWGWLMAIATKLRLA